MPILQGGHRFDEIARQWHDLAERRLAYFTELYRSGRWRHYYSQEYFALRMLDVIRAAKVWGDIVGRPHGEQQAAHDDDHRHAA